MELPLENVLIPLLLALESGSLSRKTPSLRAETEPVSVRATPSLCSYRAACAERVRDEVGRAGPPNDAETPEDWFGGRLIAMPLCPGNAGAEERIASLECVRWESFWFPKTRRPVREGGAPGKKD